MSSADIRNRYFDDLTNTAGLIWMGQNTNHIPAHPAVTAAMHASITAQEFNAYAPPLGFEALRSAVAADLGVPDAAALITEGGVNAIAAVCRARCRPGTTLVTTDPTWKWPCLFARQMGAEVVQIPIYTPDTNYKLTPAALAAAVDRRTALIYIVDPNNPLGIRYDRAEIEAFAEIARKVGALFIHDCTYRDFARGHTPVLQVAPEGTVVTLSFSKWLGLAGMRIGALVSSADLVAECGAQSTSVLGASVIAQRAALAGLAVKAEWMAEVRRITQGNNAMLVARGQELGLVAPIPDSHANFIILETIGLGLRPEALVEAARRDGIMIRQGAYHSEAFGNRFVKISTSVPEAWAARLSERLPLYIEQARSLNEIPDLF